MVGDSGQCFGPGCAANANSRANDGNSPNGPSNTAPNTPSPVTPNPNRCTSDAQCTAPFVCNLKGKKCVPPTAKNGGLCDPIEGVGCPSGQQCIAGICQAPPSTCTNNDGCPAAYVCQAGACVPDSKGQPGCKSNSQCPAGQACVGGSCLPQAVCNIPHAANRMQGVWQFDSRLHVRDGLRGLTKGVLSLAGSLQKIIGGKFSIKGVPSFLSAIVATLVKDLVKQYVPPWGMQVIAWLANVNDVLDDWRVVSTETLSAVGADQYKGYSDWVVIEFEYQGKKVSTNPVNIPGIGKVTTEGYTAREVCGVFFIDKHKLKNKFGSIYRWAAEAMLTGITCSMKNGPCYKDLNTMFNDVIDCPALGKAVSGANSSISSLGGVIEIACTSQKQNFIKMLLKELDDLTAKMTYMSLRAKAGIVNNNTLTAGRWYGVLGGAYGKGNFEGSFTGLRR